MDSETKGLAQSINIINAYIFAFIVFGFPPLTFLVSQSSDSRSVTIVYRIVVFVLSIIVLLKKEEQGLLEVNKNHKQLIPVKILLIAFLLIYSIRILHDTTYSDSREILMNDFQDYILKWFFTCLIPSFVFLNLHKEFDAHQTLIISWITLVITCILCLGIDRNTSLVFIEQGRLDRKSVV